MPIIGALFAWIGKWFTKAILTIIAKVGFTTFQAFVSGAIIVLKIIIVVAIANLIVLLFTTMQTFIHFSFTLSGTSTSESVKTAMNVLKAVGVWDGMIDSFHLVLPFFETVLSIRLSQLGIRLLNSLSNQADKIIKTAMSYGV